MTALPNAKSRLSSAIDTVTKPYANATATTQEMVSQVLSSNLSSINDDGELLVSSCWEACLRSSSLLLHFLSSRTVECTGNGGPGLITMRQQAGSASVFLALRVKSSVRVLSWHATALRTSSLASGDDGFGPKRLAERSIALIVGTAATTWSTALARNVGSRKIPTKHQGAYWRALACARARLPSVYPLRDHSRSQVFVDEGES